MNDPLEASSQQTAGAVLRFWFEDTRPRQWFAKDPAFDALLHEHFSDLSHQAIAGALTSWAGEPRADSKCVTSCLVGPASMG